MTRVIPVDRDHPDPSILAEAAAILRAGGLVAFPTETVYGLGADATSSRAVAKIYEAKGRPATNPLIVHAPDVDQIRLAVSSWPETASILANAFWPGPLTLVLPRSDQITEAATAGNETVGIRVPDCQVALDFLRQVGRPVAAPSANRSTGVSPTTAQHVLSDLDGRIDMILDAGPTPVGIESTVLDLTTSPPRLLRPGAITAGQIERALGMTIDRPSLSVADSDHTQTSPGQMAVHYSPCTVLRVIDATTIPNGDHETLRRSGLIVAGPYPEILHESYARCVIWADPVLAARELYSTLHEWDDGSLEAIEVVLPPENDESWRAIRDRLWRASRRWAR